MIVSSERPVRGFLRPVNQGRGVSLGESRSGEGKYAGRRMRLRAVSVVGAESNGCASRTRRCSEKGYDISDKRPKRAICCGRCRTVGAKRLPSAGAEKIGSVPEESGMETPGKIFNRNE